MTAAVTGATKAVTGTDLQKGRVSMISMMMKVESLLLPGTGITVGKTVWTVAVTGMDVGVPDICWFGEKVTAAVLVMIRE